jgi:hypothetical protein
MATSSLTLQIRPIPATPAEIAEMWDALPGRPALTDYAAWMAEGIEAAAEVRAFERSRSALMRGIYGEAA